MATIQPQTLKGFRDFLPAKKRQRDFVAQKVREIFEIFGFEPLETPTLEYASLLLGKYGKEADKLIYSFKDRGDREVALRYDQTVPSARVLAQYQNVLPKYFRRYQIQNVFRADNTQKGRYREFTQCDIDIFGSSSAVADAEIIAATYFAFKNVGFKQVILSINDRQTLFKALTPYASEKIDVFSIIQSVDKLEKIGQEKVMQELIDKGLEQNKASEAFKSITTAIMSDNLREIIDYSIKLGVLKESIKFLPTLARGLDYYTGMIFEVILPDYEGGSCGGGGRYDKLIGQLGAVDIPAVGIAFGFDRMVEAAEALKIIPEEIIGTQVLVTIFDPNMIFNSLTVADKLRRSKIKTEVYPTIDKLDKQLKYADKIKVPYVVIIGPEEVKKNVVKVKDMKTGEQKEYTIESLLKFLISN